MVLVNVTIDAASARRPFQSVTALDPSLDARVHWADDYCHQMPDYHMCSFYEQRPMNKAL